MSHLASSLFGWQYRARQWVAGRLYRLRHRAVDRATPTEDPNHVLLVIAGHIGDTVMSTPLIIEARRAWPGARITVLGQKHNCDLLSACPLVDACEETPTIPFALRRRRETARLKVWLREQKFDVAVMVLGDQFALATAEAGIPIRVGVQGSLLEPCLTHTYPIVSPRAWGPAERLNALRALGYDVRNVSPRLWVSPAAVRTGRRRLERLGLPEETPYVAVHPFGSAVRQWWPVQRVGELAEGLWRRCGWNTVVIGGPETRGQLPDLTVDSLIDATGALSLPELLAVVENARLVISTDSGPFHIAGALGRPLVGLFRARRPEHATRYPQARVLFGHDPSCDTSCRWDHCQSAPCRQMRALGAAEVLNAVRLAQEGNPASRKRVSQRTN
ncbi:MAG: hypothetical protein A2V70_04575 [Planctomycetes bacterium RBG_13_63_9]|nr:MAG: hypothetical protein A2V70_04575 [Planctomycetes bacterium RBG_13_63_9]